MHTVTVMIRAKLDGKYPFLPAVWSGNGKLKANVAFVDGVERKVEGPYYLRFTECGRRKFELVGRDAATAFAAAQKKEAILKAKAAGVVIAEDRRLKRTKLTVAVAEYRSEIKEHKAWASYRAYSTALNMFVKGCDKTYVDEVSRDCIMAFAVALKKKEYAERTVFNRFGYVYTFLKRYGKRGLVTKNDWPKYEDIEYEIYSEEDIRKMLAVCETLSERALIRFASDTGFRKGEIAHAEISDINFTEKTIQTRSKIEWKFTTKDHEQRIIPVSDSLLEVLQQHCQTVHGTLLFPTRVGKPNDHLNRIIVRIAKRAGVTVPKKPCHAFRAFYATSLVRSGTDIYTVQRMLGHSDVATTLAYLRAVKRNDPNLRKQVNAASV